MFFFQRQHRLNTSLKLKIVAVVLVMLAIAVFLPHQFFTFALYQEKTDIFTPTELKWLEAHPVVKVAPDPDYAPVEFYKSGEFQGISIDLLRAIGTEYGINFQFIPYKSWEDALNASKRGEVQMISAIIATEKRSEYLNFTRPYLVMPTKLFIRGNADPFGSLSLLKGKRIASIRGYATSEYLSLVAPEANIVMVDDIEDGLTRLSLGEVDGFLADRGQVGFYLSELNIGNIVLDQTVDLEFPFNLSMAAIKSEPELQSILQKCIDEISKDTFEEIKRNWLKSEWYSLGISKKTLVGSIILFILAAITIAIFIFWNARLQKRVAEKERFLEQELKKSQTLEQQMRILIDVIPYPIFTKDSEYRFVTVNKAYADFFGLKPEDFKGVSDQFIYEKNDQTPLSRYRALEEQVFQTQQPATIDDYYLVDSMGKGHFYKLHKRPCPLIDHHRPGLIAIAVDVTEIKEKEQQRIVGLNRLVSNIATKINTPLGNIVSSLSYLQFQHFELLDARSQQRFTNAHMQRYQDAVGEVCEIGINGMNRIKSIMEAFTSLELLQSHGEVTQVNLYDLLSILITSKRSEMDFSYVLKIPEELTVLGFEKVFQEVFSRIIDNVAEHAYQKSGIDGFSSPNGNKVEIYYEDIGDHHQIRVCDNGVGIPEELIGIVLDPLYSTTSHMGSLGLGLSIAASLTREVLGGDFTIKNLEAGGIQVAVTFKKTTLINLN